MKQRIDGEIYKQVVSWLRERMEAAHPSFNLDLTRWDGTRMLAGDGKAKRSLAIKIHNPGVKRQLF